MVHILLIEDDPTLQQMYQTKLRADGFNISVAGDGISGLQTALRDHPNLILLDIGLPKMNGLDVMDKIRQDEWGRNVPIIILTGMDTDNARINEIIKHKPAYYLLKSDTTPQEVMDKIREVLGV